MAERSESVGRHRAQLDFPVREDQCLRRDFTLGGAVELWGVGLPAHVEARRDRTETSDGLDDYQRASAPHHRLGEPNSCGVSPAGSTTPHFLRGVAPIVCAMIASPDFSSSVKPARTATDRAARAASTREEALHDIALVRRFNAGDESAFVEIIARYRERMFAVAFSMLRNRADAEEIAQDTFIRAHRGLAGFRGDSALGTWLHRIALNLSRNRYWYNFRRGQHTTRPFDSEFSDDNPTTLASLIASDVPSPVQEATTSEFSELVDVCMEQLGPGHREVLTRRNILNCSYDEIARTLGISIGTVKSRIARARGSLRVLLAKACPEFAPDAAPSEWFESTRHAGGMEVIWA